MDEQQIKTYNDLADKLGLVLDTFQIGHTYLADLVNSYGPDDGDGAFAFMVGGLCVQTDVLAQNLNLLHNTRNVILETMRRVEELNAAQASVVAEAERAAAQAAGGAE